MVDLRDFVTAELNRAPLTEKADFSDVVAYFVDNNWFGKRPMMVGGKVLLDEDQVATFQKSLRVFLAEAGNKDWLMDKLSERFPITAVQLQKFFKAENISEDICFYLADFLLYRLQKDLVLYSDAEVSFLLRQAAMDMIKVHGDCLTFFMAWLRAKGKTNFHRDYVMEKRYTMDIQNEAYDFDEYLRLLYYLFNKEYIAENEMYQKAAESKNYTDTWLYLSIHFICSLRYPDLARIYHPDLPYPPQEVLRRIRDNTFSENDSKMVLLSITERMCLLPFTPQKTESTSGVDHVKLCIPHSCEDHFGKLFALAEAHQQLAHCKNVPIIRKISTYAEINRYMGEEIGNLFLESDFRSRSATKSYLQSIYMLTDDVLADNKDVAGVKGYLLAALARSHKGSYGEFAATTFEYLKDAKMNGLSPEFVAYELLERGVLSFIPAMLLKMITGDEYTHLSVHKQTQMIQALDLSPHEVERMVVVVDKGKRQAELAIKEAVTGETDILTALHRIGTGQAFSKNPDCLCLLTSLGKMCPFTERRVCVGCKYEISTKAIPHK